MGNYDKLFEFKLDDQARREITRHANRFADQFKRYQRGAFTMSAPVGDRRRDAAVKNRYEDVFAVQVALQMLHTSFPQQALYLDPGYKQYWVHPGKADGKCRWKTRQAIKNMQRWFLHRSEHPRHAGVLKSPSELCHRSGVAPNPGFAKSHPSHYSFMCMAHLLGSLERSQLPLPATAEALVKLLESKTGQIYILGSCVPKWCRDWLGPWDCSEFVSWGLYQILGTRLSSALPGGTILGALRRKSRAANGLRYWNGSVGEFRTHLQRLERTRTDLVERITDANAIRTTPGLIGASNGHVHVTNGSGGTIEAGMNGRVGSDKIGSYILRNFTHWKVKALYR